MFRLSKSLTLFICLVTFSIGVWADYNKGLEAYEEKDYQLAFAYWLTSANNGDANSQYWLGKLYEKGTGTFQSDGTAYLFYDKSAAQGKVEAAKARDAIAEKINTDGFSESATLKQHLINHLTIQAAIDVSAGRLANDPNNNDALSRYKQILKLDPGNQTAVNGIVTLSNNLSIESETADNSSVPEKPVSVTIFSYIRMTGSYVGDGDGDFARSVQDATNEYALNRFNIEYKDSVVNEDMFVESLQYDLFDKACTENNSSVLLGGNYEPVGGGDGPGAGGGFSQSIVFISYNCDTKLMFEKRYEVHAISNNDSIHAVWKQKMMKFLREASPFNT